MAISWFQRPAFIDHLARIAHYPTQGYSTTYPTKSTKWMTFTSNVLTGVNATYQTFAALILSIKYKQLILQTWLLHRTISLKVLPVIGGIASVVDSVLEGKGIYHCHKFIKQYPQESILPKLSSSFLSAFIPSAPNTKQKELKERLSHLHATYFTLTREKYHKLLKKAQEKHPCDHTQQDICLNDLAQKAMSKKRAKLTQCVGKSFTEQLEKTLPSLTRNLSSYRGTTRTAATEHAVSLLKDMHTQAHKSILVHSIGLSSSLLFLGAFILSAISTIAPVIPLALTVVGLIVFVARHMASVELMRQKGWQFSLSDATRHSFVLPAISTYQRVYDWVKAPRASAF